MPGPLQPHSIHLLRSIVQTTGYTSPRNVKLQLPRISEIYLNLKPARVKSSSMSQAKAPTPGMLHVTMQPKPSLHPAQFHDWHGPGRLRYPFCLNGFRYRALDLPLSDPYQHNSSATSDGGSKEKPEWLAIYDITDMAEMLVEPYINLRKAPIQSQRERDTMKEIFVDRRFYDLLPQFTRVREGSFVDLQDPTYEGKEGIMVMERVLLAGGKGDEEEQFWKAYEGGVLGALQGSEEWLRSRAFKTATVDNRERMDEIMLLHEFSASGSSPSLEHLSEPTRKFWAGLDEQKLVQSRETRVYSLWYTFGPAPRELKALEAPGYEVDYTITDGITSTISKKQGVRPSVTSYVTTPDGAKLQYRIEGSSDPRAPTIILSNSILVSYEIWDDFLDAFFEKRENQKYRVVRYLTRGRTSDVGKESVTVDVLAKDIVAILDALRVPKAALVMGVSLGGATTLCVGLKYPDRVDRFISCDTSAKSPAGNAKAWGDRIAIAEKEGSVQQSSGEPIVGGELAEITTKRWFVKESYDGKELEAKCWAVNDMVKNNSLAGFKKSVEALWEYDLTPNMVDANVKGMFLVGGSDGVLPAGMKKMSEALKDSQYALIEGAGHLPMVEKPKEVAEVVTKFLSS